MSRRKQRTRRSRTRAHLALTAGSGLALVATALSGSVSDAATHPTITVTSLGDTGTPSAGNVLYGRAPTLADAIDYLDTRTTGGTITFASTLSGTINLTHRLPTITEPIHIQGPGQKRLTLKNHVTKVPVVTVKGGGTTEISGVTVSGGQRSGILAETPLRVENTRITGNSDYYSGGGIDQLGSNLTVIHSTIADNVSTYPKGGGGGIFIYGKGQLTVVDSTISGNRASFAGGIETYGPLTTRIERSTISGNTAINNVGGIDLVAYSAKRGPTAFIENSTIANNRALQKIGAIYLGDGGKNGPTALTMIGSTIVGNVAKGGRAGGIEDFYGRVLLADSIVAANSDAGSGTSASPDLAIFNTGSKPAVPARFSLIGNATQTITTSLRTDSTDITGTASKPVSPNLSPLGRHGGPTKTMAPKKGSRARGTGNATLYLSSVRGFPFNVDQRHRTRIGLFGSSKLSDGTDMGAVEVTQLTQTKSFRRGNQRFSLTTAARNRPMNPAQGLPVYLHANKVRGLPHMRFRQVVLHISGQKIVHRYKRADRHLLLSLRGLSRGHHTLRARVTYTYVSNGRTVGFTRTLKPTIDVG